MASTNKTTNLELSQYVSSDKPTYLVDYNSDMAKIDTGVHTAQVTADTASTAATNAQTTAEGAQTTANTAITNAGNADTKAQNALNDIGTLANLTTVEKSSLVGAINEVDLHSDTNTNAIGSLSELDTNVKTSLVSAINEVLSDTHVIEYGTVGSNQMTSYNLGQDIYKKFNLTFAKTYTVPPVVMITTYNNGYTTYGFIPSEVANITTTGCTLLFGNSISTNLVGINYIIISKN